MMRYLVWHYDKNEEYSVHSGYKLAMSFDIAEYGGSEGSKSKYFCALWHAHIPNKVRFMSGDLCSMLSLCTEIFLVEVFFMVLFVLYVTIVWRTVSTIPQRNRSWEKYYALII